MKRKQTTIDDMLKKKQPKEDKDDDNRIKISPYLLVSNDLTQETMFEVSTMAKVYFRDHSNINEILDRYLERENIKDANKESYLSGMIRHVIYYRRRRDYPFNMFKFESDYHECIGKFLLRNPNIRTQEDLQETNLFLLQNNIVHCQVSMDIDNKFRADEQEYLNRKIERIGYQNLKPFLQMGTDHAIRQYNQEHKVFQKYNIDEISLEEMCQISTIERVIRIEMEKKSIPESAYERCLESMYRALKINKGLALTLEGFYIYPQYLLITNNLTPEQERTVTLKKDRFYAYTNAKDLLAINRRDYPVSDETADPVTKRKERRKTFYLKYIRLIDKKHPPFNNLLWTKKEDIPITQNPPENDANDNQLESVAAGPSNNSVWRKKAVTEKGNTALASHNNDTAIVFDNRNETENIIENRFARNPKDYLAAPKAEPEYMDIIKFLMKQNEIVEEIKSYIVDESVIATTWEKNSQVILWNFILFNMKDRNKNFLNLLIKCPSKDRQQLDKMLKRINIYVDFDNVPQSIIGDPIATSTQTLQSPPIQDNQQNRPFQSSANSVDIVNIHDKSPECTIRNVKQEKHSQQNDDDSDVFFVTPNPTDVISISDEENNINNRIVPENNGIDVYQKNLNIESQANHESSLNSLEAEYGLKSHGLALQNVTNRRPAQRKNVPSRMVYDSDATSNNNGNSRNADYNILQESNNFSVFFSTQLMFDYAYHSSIKTLLTYAKHPKSSVSSSNQNDYRPCFVLETQRVMFIKDHKFEIFIDLPLFSLYDIHIRNYFIKKILNLNDLEWNILLSNLNLLESYEFVRKNYGHSRSKKEDEFENVIKKHLDLFFSSLTNFKKFHFRPSEDFNNHIECINSNIIINSKNIAKSIKPSILQKIKLLKK